MSRGDAGRRAALVAGAGLLLAGAALALTQPVAQDPAYHRFADTRTFLGVPRAGDVLSNLAFLAVGLHGLAAVAADLRRGRFASRAAALPYALFFAAVALVAAGSAHYHAAPDNGRLLWDRLPMTVAFAALFAAFVADRIDGPLGIGMVLPAAVAAGLAAALYWAWTESLGRGDLRPYLLVQALPAVLTPLICRLYPPGRHTDGRYLAAMLLAYAAALGAERLDAAIFALTGELVSGHTAKHLLAAGACHLVLPMVRRR